MRQIIACSGRNAEVEVVGEGPDVVFVGTAVPMAWTREAAEKLSAAGYRVVNFDYGSGADDPEPRTALQQVADVLTVMDGLGIESASLVGLSRGAMTAYALAADHPERTDALVLAFPVAGFEDTMMIVDPDPEPEEDESQESFMKRFLATIFSPQFISSDFERVVTMVTTPAGSVARVDRSEETPFPEGMQVTKKSLVIEGGADKIVRPEHPKRYLEAIDGAQHVLVEGAFHGWLMEEPDEFARIVADFLAS